MNTQSLQQFITNTWDDSIVPTLQEYIRIPNKSPAYDPAWEQNGYMEKAVQLLTDWCQQHAVKNMQLHVHRLPGKTPLILIDVPGQNDKTALLYGHLDKQPEMTGWDSDKGPWLPVLKNNRLYGRGGADDGYAIFAALTAIKALQEQNIPHPHCVILIEASEESGSSDLPAYLEQLGTQLGKPELIICLDSGCGNYEQLWCTTSLRGLINAELSVRVLNEGIHSGVGSGIVPSSWRILRQLLNRIENENTGEILLPELHAPIPKHRVQEAEKTAVTLDKTILQSYPWASKTKPVTTNLAELLLNRSWRPALEITGVAGIPDLASAGNVLRPFTSVTLSLRLPPTCDATKAAEALTKTITENPPYDAEISLKIKSKDGGWNAPTTAPWLSKVIDQASQAYFGKPAMLMGEGGSIPFMGMLGKKFPQAQFMITGVLGPHSNAHGPNEFLDIPMGKKLTCAVAQVLSESYLQSK